MNQDIKVRWTDLGRSSMEPVYPELLLLPKPFKTEEVRMFLIYDLDKV